MKKILGVLLLAGAAGYYFYQRAELSEPKDPVYAELRMAHENGVELLGIGKMYSQSDCEQRSERFWSEVFTRGAQFKFVASNCTRELPARYLRMFANEATHATYIAMDRGKAGERDGRFVIFGVPSSDAAKACGAIIAGIKATYTGKVQCVQGTVG